ncbi:MAG TPA: tetratricopeptide repeat protein [Thermoanaerobaculia bacterium]|nr:tetratricopeptide repeat protein [Thermoanaerobaculia bacterium]
MKRDTVVFTICGFALGIVIGTFFIGPHLAKPQVAPTAGVANAAEPETTTSAPPMAQMNAVREQLSALKQRIERDPRDTAALTQLGTMYMDAAKFPQAIDYFERALAVREDPTTRADLGICYKQNGQLEKALAAFQRAASESPEQWQSLYNEALVLGEMQRWDDARAVAAKLSAMRPNDAQVAQLVQSLKSK